MNFGVFGGTFDPPHLGHRRLIESALEQLNLDELVVMPAGRNPLKNQRNQSPRTTRLEMACLAFEDLAKVSISDIEANRPGPSYALDSLMELQAARPGKYWFIMGADALKTIEQWKQPDRLSKLCRFAVAVRPPQVNEDVLLTTPERYRPNVDLLTVDACEFSSTEVRDRVHRNLPIDRMVEPKIETFIRDHNLYRH